MAMELWALVPRVTASGVRAEWALVQLRTEDDIPAAVDAVFDVGAILIELLDGDKLVDGIVSPSVAYPTVLA